MLTGGMPPHIQKKEDQSMKERPENNIKTTNRQKWARLFTCLDNLLKCELNLRQKSIKNRTFAIVIRFRFFVPFRAFESQLNFNVSCPPRIVYGNYKLLGRIHSSHISVSEKLEGSFRESWSLEKFKIGSQCFCTKGFENENKIPIQIFPRFEEIIVSLVCRTFSSASSKLKFV